jgi:DNA-directed RNA polymerase subunit RPC12/RpoP
MSAVNRIFECSRCGRTTIIHSDPVRCRECGSMTGVVKTVDRSVISQLLEEGSQPWMSDASKAPRDPGGPGS